LLFLGKTSFNPAYSKKEGRSDNGEEVSSRTCGESELIINVKRSCSNFCAEGGRFIVLIIAIGRGGVGGPRGNKRFL